MTIDELAKEMNDKHGISDWPRQYQVDHETYANVCQAIFTKLIGDIDMFMDWDKLELRENTVFHGSFRTVSIAIGPRNGLMFKGVELILKVK